MTSQLLSLTTEAPFHCVSLTKALHSFVQRQGKSDGAVVISGQHTTTAIIISADNDVRFLEKNYLESGEPGPVSAYSFPVVSRQGRG